MERQANLAFVPAQRLRSFEHIVEQIREAIASGGLVPGDRLPSERDLCLQFGVSRTTLREALRALEAVGVVEIRVGAHGGAFASEPTADLVGDALATLLRFRGATARDLAEFRASFEAENAFWASSRRTDERLSELERIVAAVERAVEDPAGDWAMVAALEVRFHEAVANATENAVRAAIMTAILDALERVFVAVALPADSPLRRELVDELSAIVDAIRAGHGDAARQLMRAHVERWSELEISHE